MSADIVPACPLPLTTGDLSLFRDDDLAADRARAIASHLDSCPACAERLAAYDRIGAGLRAIPEPPLDGGRFWRKIAARAGGRRPTRASTHMPLRRAFTGVGAVAAVLLVAIAFAQLFASRGGPMISTAPTATNRPTPTVAPTPTVTLAHPIAWKQLAFPSEWDHPSGAATPSIGGGVTYANATLGFTAADPNTIYACDGHPNGTYIIWISHDRGATWSRAGTLPTSKEAGCKVIVDSADAQTAIVRLGWYEPGASPVQPSGLVFATTDGGRSWAALPGNYDYAQVASYRGTVYVLRLDAPGDPDQRYRLMASSDGMRTWRQLDQTLADRSATMSAFWLNPANGSILAYAFVGSARSFWLSPDAGQTWKQLAHPDNNMIDIAVQWPNGSGAWHMCSSDQPLDVPPAQAHNRLACTTDGGQTWIERPVLDISLTCNCLKGQPFTSTAPLNLVGIAPDGSLLATVVDRYDDAGDPHVGLYRLAPGSSQWERLGDTTSNDNLFLLPSGVLWMSGWRPTNPASFWAPATFVSTGIYP